MPQTQIGGIESCVRLEPAHTLRLNLGRVVRPDKVYQLPNTQRCTHSSGISQPMPVCSVTLCCKPRCICCQSLSPDLRPYGDPHAMDQAQTW